MRVLRVVSGCMLALLIWGLMGTTAKADADYGYVMVDLNLRTGPGMRYGIILVMPEGSSVSLTGDTAYGWDRVVYDGTVGWAYDAYIGESSAPSVPVETVNYSGSIRGIITEAAYRYGQSPSAMIAVAQCESDLDPGAYNPSSGAAGLFQFLYGTWLSTPYAGYSRYNAWASANAAAWMWSVGRRGEWVC